MSNKIAIFGAIIVLAAAGFLIQRFAAKNNAPGISNNQVNFVHEGNIFMDNPGFTPGVWYISYAEPGSAALNRELKFNQPNSDLQTGMRVRVEGHEDNNVVAVSKLDILNAHKSGLIWVDTPRPNDTIINPITVHGWAKGSWYFEAVFPVKVVDASGKILSQSQAQALGDWMTDNYVEFTASLNYSKSSTETGTLVLEKDNPSGLKQNADELSIPIRFGTEGRAVKLYYYDPNKDKDIQGNLLCSRQGLVAVDRQIPITNTPIQDTIKLLLQGNIAASEKASGITTEYPLDGVELAGANLVDRTLTLEFKDPLSKTGGGSCRVSVLWAQVEATAKQFPGIATVKFIPEELFQP